MTRKVLKHLLKLSKRYEETGSLFLGLAVFLICLGVLSWAVISRATPVFIQVSPQQMMDRVKNTWSIWTSKKDNPFAPDSVHVISSPEAQQRTHLTTASDTLWKLAQQYYNDGYQWTRIYEANKTVIEDPNRLEKGLELVIPE